MTNKPENCDNCARCCTWYVEVYNEDDIPEEMTEIWEACDPKIPEELKSVPLEDLPPELFGPTSNVRVMKRRKDSKTCVALDLKTLKCSIYDKRPTVCREFEVGEGGCLLARENSPVEKLS